MSEHPDLERVKRACEDLAEHFDTVQVFVTRVNDEEDPDDRGTVNATWGTGNWFARYGQVKSWVIKKDEQTRMEARE